MTSSTQLTRSSETSNAKEQRQASRTLTLSLSTCLCSAQPAPGLAECCCSRDRTWMIFKLDENPSLNHTAGSLPITTCSFRSACFCLSFLVWHCLTDSKLSASTLTANPPHPIPRTSAASLLQLLLVLFSFERDILVNAHH